MSAAKLAMARDYLARRPEHPCACAACVLQRESERVKAVLADYAKAKVTPIKRRAAK